MVTLGPLRVVHVLQTINAAAGGPPVSCTNLAAAQASRGHRVTIVTQASPPGVSSVPVSPSVEVIEISDWLGWMEFFATRRSRLILRKLCRGASVVHLHGVWDSLVVVGGVESQRAGVPYVIAPRGILDPWSLSQKWWKKRFALSVIVRRHLNRAAALHMLNQDESDLVARLLLKPPRVVVPNGANLGEIDRSLHDVGPNQAAHPYILFLGRLHYKKGLDVLADAFSAIAAKHPTVRLMVAGEDDGGRATFEALVRQLKLGPRVAVVGPLYGGAKWAALSGASCFCLPSRQEGFSVAVLEALACRVPVVISDTCHFPEVSAAGAGVVVPLAPDAVANAILSILDNAPAATAMGAAGRRLVEDWFTWDRVAETCDGMYSDILKG